MKFKTILIIGIVIFVLYSCWEETKTPNYSNYKYEPTKPLHLVQHEYNSNNKSTSNSTSSNNPPKINSRTYYSEPIQCISCGGSGVCSLCHGSGKIIDSRPKSVSNRCPCVYNSGSGVCSSCKGKGTLGGGYKTMYY